MTDETTPRSSDDTATGGGGAAPRRRRRATSPATAPQPAQDTATGTSATTPQTAADAKPATEKPQGEEKPTGGETATKRPRRSTRRTAPPAQDQVDGAADGASAPGGASGETGEGAPVAETPAKRPARRRRAASSEGPSASSDGSGPTADQGEVPPTAGDDASSTPDDSATGRPRRGTRRRSGSAAVEQPADEAATGATSETTGSEAATDEGDGPAPRKARPRRSGSRKAPVQDTPAADDATSVTPEGTPDEDSPSAGRRTRAGRSTRRRGPDAATGSATTTDRDETPTAEPAPLDVLAELGPPKEPEADGDAGPRLAATALLFQAPEPARGRRRRAQAPAGPPVPPAEQERVQAAEEEAPDEDAQVEDTTGPAAEVTDQQGTGGSEGTGATEESDGSEGSEGSAESAGADDTEDGEDSAGGRRRRRRRGGRGRRGRADRGEEGSEDGDAGRGASEGEGDGPEGTGAEPEGADGADGAEGAEDSDGEDTGSGSRRRRRRRSRSGRGGDGEDAGRGSRNGSDEVTALKGSTRLEAKRQRRREGRDAGRRRAVITEAEFLARRESVERSMVVREQDGRIQIAVLEDGVLVEHFVARTGRDAQSSASTTVGNVYLGRVQNVLPSMEAAFVDVGKGRNAVLYAGEVNWDAAGLEGQPRRIEQALKSGDPVLVQVTKDPIGHKGARLTSQITLAGRYLVFVPGGGMTGISRKLPDTERSRLKKLLKEILPDDAGVIVRTAAEGASDEELRRDVQRLQDQWAAIQKKAGTANAPALLQGEPDLAIRVVRDIFNDDFSSLVVQGEGTHRTIAEYVGAMAPDLAERVSAWSGDGDVFSAHRVDEQLAKAMDRKVWLPSGGSLVIDRTEAMTVVDVNTGKFTGSGGTLEETVTRNNLEAAEEIVRQLRLRDIGGIIVIDFIDMVLESNRDLVLRRLVECLGRDRTKHQVAEVTSLGLVQMTRKRVGQGLVEAFSDTCEHCHGRGYIVHAAPHDRGGDTGADGDGGDGQKRSSRRKRSSSSSSSATSTPVPVLPEAREAVKATLATIAAAAAHAHDQAHEPGQATDAEPAPAKGAGGADGDASPVPEGDTRAADSAEVPAAQKRDVAPRRKRARRAEAPAGAPAEKPTPDPAAALAELADAVGGGAGERD